MLEHLSHLKLGMANLHYQIRNLKKWMEEPNFESSKGYRKDIEVKTYNNRWI